MASDMQRPPPVPSGWTCALCDEQVWRVGSAVRLSDGTVAHWWCVTDQLVEPMRP